MSVDGKAVRLEHGKHYQTFGGSRVGPMEKGEWGYGKVPCFTNIGGPWLESYREDGTLIGFLVFSDDPRHIASEWSEENQEAPEGTS